MMQVGEVRKWLEDFKDDEFIAIDDGGLALVSLDAKQYCEVGGIPLEEDEDGIPY